jgi:hypothetical protein
MTKKELVQQLNSVIDELAHLDDSYELAIVNRTKGPESAVLGYKIYLDKLEVPNDKFQYADNPMDKNFAKVLVLEPINA